MADGRKEPKSKYTLDRGMPGAFEGETVTRRNLMNLTAQGAGSVAIGNGAQAQAGQVSLGTATSTYNLPGLPSAASSAARAAAPPKRLRPASSRRRSRSRSGSSSTSGCRSRSPTNGWHD